MVHEGIIIAFTSARHLSITWASSIHSTPPHPTSWSSILILSSHLRLGLPSDLFPSGFVTKTLYKPLLFPIRATFPAHLILFDFITRTTLGEQYKSNLSINCRIYCHRLEWEEIISLCLSVFFVLPIFHYFLQWRTQEFYSGGGSTNSVEDRGQRERGSGGGSPLVRGSGGSCNLVQEISFHIVKFS